MDRIEGALAVLTSDSEHEHLVSLTELPRGLREGDVLRTGHDSNGKPNWTTTSIDDDESDRRKRHAEETLQELRRRDPGGDITI